jgi:hypothetical protein
MSMLRKFQASLRILKALSLSVEFGIFLRTYLAAVNRANYVLKNIPNSTERERALRILKEAYKQLGYDEYAEKISGFETN